MIWIGHFVELTETITNYTYRISICIHSLLIPFNKSVTSGVQSLIFFYKLIYRTSINNIFGVISYFDEFYDMNDFSNQINPKWPQICLSAPFGAVPISTAEKPAL